MINFIGVSKGHYFDNRIKIWLAEKENGQTRVVNALKLSEPITEASTFAEPTCDIENSVAQSLMDKLWDCGLRPSEGSGSAGAMAATQRHLEDMRTLVFKEPKP